MRPHASHESPFTVSDTFTHPLSGRHRLQLLGDRTAILALLFHHWGHTILIGQDHHIILNRPYSIRISDTDLIVRPAIRITPGLAYHSLSLLIVPPRPSSRHVIFVPRQEFSLISSLLVPSQF